jgi:hypothetical protein
MSRAKGQEERLPFIERLQTGCLSPEARLCGFWQHLVEILDARVWVQESPIRQEQIP